MVAGKITVFVNGSSKGNRNRIKVMIQNIAVNLNPIFANTFSLQKSREITIRRKLLTITVISTDEKLK